MFAFQEGVNGAGGSMVFPPNDCHNLGFKRAQDGSESLPVRVVISPAEQINHQKSNEG